MPPSLAIYLRCRSKILARERLICLEPMGVLPATQIGQLRNVRRVFHIKSSDCGWNLKCGMRINGFNICRSNRYSLYVSDEVKSVQHSRRVAEGIGVRQVDYSNALPLLPRRISFRCERPSVITDCRRHTPCFAPKPWLRTARDRLASSIGQGFHRVTSMQGRR
jgi:hypothetical protein